MLFLELPHELMERTLIELHPTEMVVLRQESQFIESLTSGLKEEQICRILRSLIDGSIELRLRIELALDGFLFGYHSDLPAYELLDVVLQRRQAFERFLPQSFWEMKCESTSSRTFETYDGVFGCSQPVGAYGAFQGVLFQELVPPGSLKGRWSLSRDEIGIDTHDFSFWMDADAVFLVERRNSRPFSDVWRIHFRHLSHNATHRLAFEPFIDFSKDQAHLVWEDCMILVWEEHIMAEFFDYEGAGGSRRIATLVFDWTTGQILLPYTMVADIAFLTKDLIILSPMPSFDARPLIFDIMSLSDGSIIFRCEFPLPDGYFAAHFHKHPVSNHNSNCPTRYAKIFLPDPTVSILPILLNPIQEMTSMQTTVVLSVHKFLRKCQQLATMAPKLNEEDRSTLQYRPLVLKWDEWGPDVTRWLPAEIHGEYGSRMVSGTRMLALLRNDNDINSPFRNVILDFNPRAIHRDTPEDASDEYEFMVIKHETESIFPGSNVKSRLAYRTWTSNLEFRYRNVSLEAHTIIGRLEDDFHFFSFLPPNAGGEIPPRML